MPYRCPDVPSERISKNYFFSTSRDARQVEIVRFAEQGIRSVVDLQAKVIRTQIPRNVDTRLHGVLGNGHIRRTRQIWKYHLLERLRSARHKSNSVARDRRAETTHLPFGKRGFEYC